MRKLSVFVLVVLLLVVVPYCKKSDVQVPRFSTVYPLESVLNAGEATEIQVDLMKPAEMDVIIRAKADKGIVSPSQRGTKASSTSFMFTAHEVFFKEDGEHIATVNFWLWTADNEELDTTMLVLYVITENGSTTIKKYGQFFLAAAPVGK